MSILWVIERTYLFNNRLLWLMCFGRISFPLAVVVVYQKTHENRPFSHFCETSLYDYMISKLLYIKNSVRYISSVGSGNWMAHQKCWLLLSGVEERYCKLRYCAKILNITQLLEVSNDLLCSTVPTANINQISDNSRVTLPAEMCFHR